MLKTLTYKLKENTVTVSEQFETENNVTEVVFDFTDCLVDAWSKWMDVELADGTKTTISLGTALVEAYVLPAQFMQRGRMEIQPYAVSSTSEKLLFSIKAIYVQRSIATAESNIPYDPADLTQIQNAVSAMGDRVDIIWNAYDTGQFEGEQGIQGIQGLKGDQGDQGDTGVYIGTEAPTDPVKNVWIDLDDDYSSTLQEIYDQYVSLQAALDTLLG